MSTQATFWWAGVLLECAGTLIGDFGKVLFRYAAVHESDTTCCKLFGYYAAGLVCVLALFPALDSAAYSLAAQSIVSACSGFVVAWNVLLGHKLLGERLSVSRTLGAFVIVVGTIVVGVAGNHADEPVRTATEYVDLFTRPTACAYYSCLAAVWAVACTCRFRWRDPRTAAYLQAAFGGSIAGASQFLTKAASTLVRDGLAFNATPFYLLLTLNVLIHWLGVFQLAMALRTLEALEGIALYEGMSIIGGALSGNIVFDEGSGQSQVALAFYVMGLLIVLLGLLFVGRWPRVLGDGDEQCGICVARGTGKVPRGAQQRDGEGKQLLNAQAAELGGAGCGALCCA